MRRLTLTRRELWSLRVEKTILLAMAIQLFVAAFSSFLVVGLVSMYSPSATQGAYEVEVGIAGNATDELAPVVEAGDARTVVRYADREAAVNAFERGQVDALMLATERPNGRVVVDAVAPEGSFRTTLVVVQLKDVLADFERQRRDALSHRLERKPLDLPPEVPANPYFGFTYTVLVPLLAFLPAFISGSIAVDSLAEEQERNTLDLLRVTPLSLPEIVDGKALAFVAIAPAQAALWFAFLWVNGTPVHNVGLVLLLVAAVTTVLVGAGQALAIRIPNRRESQLLYSFGTLLAFGLASLSPEAPHNAVAKLAVGSPTATTYAVVAGSVVLAAGAYAFARRAARTVG